MSTDSGRIDYAAGYIHQSWTTVIQFGLAVTLLVINLGYSAFAGIVLLVIAVPLLAKVVRILRFKRRRANLFTDARIRAIQEILSTIRAIKFYTWEQSFIKKVVDLRTKELKLVRTSMVLRNATNGFSMCLPLYASILAFITYSATGNSLKAGNVFSSLTLFNMLRGPLMFVPRVASSMIDAWVALGRIQGLLTADELEPPKIDYKHEYAVSVENGTFIWERVENLLEEHEQGSDDKGKEAKGGKGGKGKGKQKKQREWGSGRHGMMTEEDKRPKKTPHPTFHSIQDTSFNISRGDLVIIVGEIGSGKSSLLSALVNEMRRASGSLTIGGRIAYCPQTAWIRNATLRDNILFDKQYDAKWYDQVHSTMDRINMQVVSDCALEPDIEMLPSGDLTEIGERGVTLSGGQKARINMARAAYNDADIYLLDDPLSAVDAHVGHHLVERVICGLLADKTRILVTHQLQVLSRAKADQIFCIKEGKIVESGTYEELVAGDGEFSRLLRKYTREEVEIEEIEEKVAPEEEEAVVKPGRRGNKLMEKEDRLIGSIPWRVYTKYARLGGGVWIIPGVLLAVAISNGVNVTTGVWLSAWTGDRFHLQNKVYIAVYAALGFSQAFFIFFYGFILTMTGNRATAKMHNLVCHPACFSDFRR
jgi:ATP-binding cassette, subfamily C (CFTR/MRP), member 1